MSESREHLTAMGTATVMVMGTATAMVMGTATVTAMATVTTPTIAKKKGNQQQSGYLKTPRLFFT